MVLQWSRVNIAAAPQQDDMRWKGEELMAIAEKKRIGTGASGKTASSGTVTLKQIAAQLAERQDLSKKQTEAILADLVALTGHHLKKGARLRLTGLGILQVRHRAARMAAARRFGLMAV
jgi:nucleoid DNA-binding protein